MGFVLFVLWIVDCILLDITMLKISNDFMIFYSYETGILFVISKLHGILNLALFLYLIGEIWFHDVGDAAAELDKMVIPLEMLWCSVALITENVN